jgi:hypothetical protein
MCVLGFGKFSTWATLVNEIGCSKKTMDLNCLFFCGISIEQ